MTDKRKKVKERIEFDYETGHYTAPFRDGIKAVYVCRGCLPSKGGCLIHDR